MNEKDHHTKYDFPPSPQILVPQRGLERVWARGETRAAFITAPAGYGKTSACARLREKTAACAYIGLDRYDNIPQKFFGRMMEALTKILKPGSEPAALPETETSDRYAGLLAGMFMGLGSGVIVLDNLHVLYNIEIINTLPFLIRELYGVRFILLSRFRPPSCFDSLSREGMLLTADAECLRLSADEFAVLADKRGLCLSRHEMEELYEATEGWPLCVSALFLAGCDRLRMKEYLGRYIKAEYWDNWHDGMRAFLLSTSVSETLCADLCQALSGKADSAALLERLYNENIFIDRTASGEYRYHRFFRDYLLDILKHDERKNSLYQKAGDWFFGRAQFKQAAQYYFACDETSLAERAIELFVLRGRRLPADELAAGLNDLPLFDLPSEKIEDSESLTAVAAYGCYLHGRVEKQLYYQDKLLPAAGGTIEPPELSHFLTLVDPRVELTDSVKAVNQMRNNGRPASGRPAHFPSVTQGLPFVHRSFRDLSELALMGEEAREILDAVFPLFDDAECGALEAAALAGIRFEKGDYAGAAAHLAKIGETAELSSETMLCIAMISAEIRYAEKRTEDAARILCDVEETLARKKEYFLIKNIHALKTRWRLRLGDRHAALRWLESHNIASLDGVTLYESYLHFTTARALLLRREDDTALMLLSKLKYQAGLYRRALDRIEADILTAAAYGRGGNMEQALATITEAVRLAQVYGYTELFSAEAQDIYLILNELSFRIMRYGYADGVDPDFLRTLCVTCGGNLGRQKVTRLAENRPPVRLAKNQTMVAELLLKGRSYQEIANEMGLKLSTIKSYIRELYNKLGVFSMEEAACKLYDMGIFQE